ncbi:MAG: methyltransferase [Chitinophagales bacterium]|nr:methyltransferase [Chitinophagales bacterium]
MANTSFQFKQFVVEQAHCAMKVNTDGVLLGAWAKVGEAARILDIGTGTGVIAMMMAQQCPAAMIDAIDIDIGAAEQAKANVECSAWNDRLCVYHSALQDFKPAYSYDFIISNPPYFVNDLKPDNARKSVAKHSVDLSYDELLTNVHRLLSDNGTFAVVIPYFNKALFLEKATGFGLFVSSALRVQAREDKTPYLALLQLVRRKGEVLEEGLVIQTLSGEYTAGYKALTQAFYLKF